MFSLMLNDQFSFNVAAAKQAIFANSVYMLNLSFFFLNIFLMV